MSHFSEEPLLEMTVTENQQSRFSLLLGGGFGLRSEVNLTLTEWFGRQPGLSADYLKDRVQTIFLDGRAVDDPDRAVVRDGSTLALSAAMPGLVGAAFRKGGRYAALRSAVSHTREDPRTMAASGSLTLKLFNMVAAEIGPLFLVRGIRLSGAVLTDFIERLPPSFGRRCRSLRYDGRQLTLSDVISRLAGRSYVWLKVACVLGEAR